MERSQEEAGQEGEEAGEQEVRPPPLCLTGQLGGGFRVIFSSLLFNLLGGEVVGLVGHVMFLYSGPGSLRTHWATGRVGKQEAWSDSSSHGYRELAGNRRGQPCQQEYQTLHSLERAGGFKYNFLQENYIPIYLLNGLKCSWINIFLFWFFIT